VTARWPELCAGLDERGVRAVEQSVAAQELEGWAPTTDDVCALVEHARSAAPSTPDPPGRARWRPTLRRRTPYLVPGTTVLANRLGLTEPAALAAAEAAASARRLCEVHLGLLPATGPPGAARLLALHRHLFGDVFDWAGRLRTVEIAKGGTRFAPVPAIWDVLAGADETVAGTDWAGLDAGPLSWWLSVVYVQLDRAHPFREGNGRAATTLLHELVAPSGHRLDLARVVRAEWVQAARDAAPFRGTGAPSPRPFVPVLRRALVPRS
jgi:cell filamentation protein